MILLWYILIPAVAAPVAWLLGRQNPVLARWTARAGHGRPAGAGGRAVDREGGRPAGGLRARGSRPGRPGGRLLDRRRQGGVDRLAGHQLLPRRRRPHAHHAAAHLRARPARRARLVARHHRARRRLPPDGPVDGGRAGRRLPLARPVPLLLLLRDDAHPDVLPHRRLGPRAARVRGDQVLHLHAGQRPADARSPSSRWCSSTGARPASTPSTSRSCWARGWASTTAMLLMLGFFAAFAVKLPAWPLHTWLPDAHTEAPTAGSVLLAGVLIKIGAYGMLRFMVPLFPDAVRDFRTWALILGVVGIIYGAIMAYAQTDMKRLVAYTSVSHMGFVLLGIFAWNTLALQGVILQLVCHALSTGALFILVGRPAGPHPHARHGQDGRPLAGGAPDGRHGHVLRHGLARPAGARQLRRRVPHPGRRLAGEPVGRRPRRRRTGVRDRLRAVDDAARLPGRGDARLVVRRPDQAGDRHVRRHDRRARAARLLAAAADHHGQTDGGGRPGDDERQHADRGPDLGGTGDPAAAAEATQAAGAAAAPDGETVAADGGAP